MVLGMAMIGETLALLWIGWSHFGLATNNNALNTFSFLLLLCFAAFSVVPARERRALWSTVPSRTLILALTVDIIVGTTLTHVGLPGAHGIALGSRSRFLPMPWSPAWLSTMK